MDETSADLAEQNRIDDTTSQAGPKVPLYRRDLEPTNFLLSANDLRDFCELLEEINVRAQKIELANVNLANFESEQEAREKIEHFISLEYQYRALNGNSVQGLGVPDTEERLFPDDLRSFFISNSAYPKRSINVAPLNVVEVFLDFRRPTLNIDLRALPSNPTENNSIVNISGRDEDWVISSAERINTFFKKRQVHRPAVHSSGTYDYVLYFFFLPMWIWLFWRHGEKLENWLNDQSIFLNVLLGIYALLASMLFARFVFQYFRWAFPPTEFYKKTRIGAFFHRAVIGIACTSLLLSAGYEAVRWIAKIII